MKSTKRFPKEIVEAIRDAKILGIRAGVRSHRVIGIWAVVVEGRVFVRSYTLKPRSWWRTFREEPRGIIEVNAKQIKVRPVFTRSERLKKLVDRAYAEKFPTPGSRVFVEGFKEKKRREHDDGIGAALAKASSAGWSKHLWNLVERAIRSFNSLPSCSINISRLNSAQ
jgi:hypothetical protein